MAEAAQETRKKVTYFIEHPPPIQINKPGLRATCQKVKRIKRIGIVCIDIMSGELIVVQPEKSEKE